MPRWLRLLARRRATLIGLALVSGVLFVGVLSPLLAGDPLRVNAARPAESLILLKPTDEDQHEGGKRFDAAGWEARVLRLQP